jgi:predicted TIM-barrel fold metal-dependent hydrolase
VAAESLKLADFRPRRELVVPETVVTAPRFGVIDAHSHLGAEFGGGWDRRPVAELLDVLDAAGVTCLVDLDGGWGEDVLDRHLRTFKEAAPDRFACFGGVDWAAWPEHGDHFPDRAAHRLAVQVRRGAQGLKIWKPFGLRVKDHRGERVRVDDERLAVLWETAADLGVPVLIHVADSVAFFRPLDARNERYELLRAHRDWHAYGPGIPAFGTLLGELANLVARHSRTTFIGAHVGCHAENLAWVSALLDRCPNFHVDLSARLDELGRQPYTARRFLVQRQDRVLFGTDWPADVGMYRIHYRFYETDDEHFAGPGGARPGVSWPLIGLCLPDQVLAKLYRGNARRLLNL